MLTLDTTGSMELSGTNDFEQLREAVVELINQVDPDPTDPVTSRLGIARWAGIKCVYNSSGSYVNPCTDDKTVLSNLTDNKSNLLKIANGTSTNCPLTGTPKPYACPLKHVEYDARNGAPGYTGTKLPNAFTVLNNGSYYAWDTSRGGRATAKKVMVMITDGQNEAWPTNIPQTLSSWDSSARTESDKIKLGRDGIKGTEDDVEVFVVGFFCSPYNANQWCKSRIAANTTPATRSCPGPVWPPTASAQTPSSIDNLLHDVSSSSTTNCDHYYPLKKTDSLPELLQSLAKRLATVRLTG
jgi:hypothetical protein